MTTTLYRCWRQFRKDRTNLADKNVHLAGELRLSLANESVKGLVSKETISQWECERVSF